MINLVAHVSAYHSYLHDRHSKGLPNRRIIMRKERDLYPDEKDEGDSDD
ncbi:hypothetical protein LSA03nite_02120 [Latilactobacillus sakei subsp. carnosus]|nr:hypothetical protein LSA03nite_02120 [Latilactobacillus sakei subsp. carnosus]